MNFKYVIIGGSAGGIGAVEAIRGIDRNGSIAVISDESTPQYSKPMISEYLSGAELEEIVYRPLNFWNEHSVKILAGKKAAKVDAVSRKVILDDGAEIVFEKLLIATGGKPIVPNIQGVEKKGVYTFTSLTDAKALLDKLPGMDRVIVVGGGLIGISLAEALVKIGKNVTIVELKDKILSLILDSEASILVSEVVEEAGVKIIAGRSATKIVGRKNAESEVGGVVLDDGTELACDLVVFAIGVTPRIDMIESKQIRVNRGVVVDRFMTTSVPDIYACGDAAEAYDFTTEDSRLLPLWPLAYVGGRIAGSNMAGLRLEYPGGTQMSSLNYFGLPVISVGMANPPNGEYEVLSNLNREIRAYRKIVLRNNEIVGMISIGKVDGSGIIFHLLKNKVNVGEFKQKVVSDDFGLIHLSEPVRLKILMRN